MADTTPQTPLNVIDFYTGRELDTIEIAKRALWQPQVVDDADLLIDDQVLEARQPNIVPPEAALQDKAGEAVAAPINASALEASARLREVAARLRHLAAELRETQTQLSQKLPEGRG